MFICVLRSSLYRFHDRFGPRKGILEHRKRINKEDHFVFAVADNGCDRPPLLANIGRASACYKMRKTKGEEREVAIIAVLADRGEGLEPLPTTAKARLSSLLFLVSCQKRGGGAVADKWT
jgi:hypothetical protein